MQETSGYALSEALRYESLAAACRLPGDPARAHLEREARWWLNHAAQLERIGR